MRKLILATAVALMSVSSLVAVCQKPAASDPTKCPAKLTKKVGDRKTKPVPADAAPACQASAEAGVTTAPQQPVTVNVQPTDLSPLIAPLTILANARENDTHTLENLGDVSPARRADLAEQYAVARIKVTTAQATLLESQATLNGAQADYTNTERKWYGAKVILDDLSRAAGEIFGATRINSTITQGSVSGGATTLSATNAGAQVNTSVVGGGAQITGSANSSNSNSTVSTNSNSSSNLNLSSNNNQSGASSNAGASASAGASANPNNTTLLNNVGNAQQSQGQGQGQSANPTANGGGASASATGGNSDQTQTANPTANGGSANATGGNQSQSQVASPSQTQTANPTATGGDQSQSQTAPSQ